MLPLVCLIVIAILIIKFYFVVLYFNSIRLRLSNVPGPTSRQLQGNLDLFNNPNGSLSESFHSTLKAMAQIYQDQGIFKLRFGNKYIVCLFKSIHLKNITGSTVNLSKSTEYNFLNEWLGGGLLLSDTGSWSSKRTLLAKTFHNDMLKQFAIVANKKADQFLSGLTNLDTFYLDTKKSFHFTVEIISETLLNYVLSEEEIQTYLDSVHQMTASFTERALNPLLWIDSIFKCTNIGRNYAQKLNALKTICKNIIFQQSNVLSSMEMKFKSNQKLNLIDTLLRKYPSLNSHNVEQICNEVNTFLFAGHDTTALTINWVLYCLGSYPQEQSKLKDELALIISPNGFIEIDQLDRLVYLDCFIKECLRLYPPVPLIGRSITNSFTVENYDIPEGIMLYILIDQLHLDPTTFHSPHKFNPRRFLDGVPPLSYIPFSAGPRNCIGKKFALSIIKVLIVKILSKYRVDSEQTPDSIQMTYDIVQKPKNELRIKLIKNVA